MALDPVVVGQPHTDAHNAERAEINALDSTVASLSTWLTEGPSLRQRIRQDVDNRTKLPLNTEATVVTTTVPDGTLSKQYTISVSGMADQIGRKMTSAELASYPVDMGQPGSYKDVYATGGIAYLWNLGINDDTMSTPPNNFFRLMPSEYRVRTNAPKIAFLLYRLQGLVYDSHQVFVNGQPVSLRSQAGVSTSDYLVLTFPDSATRDISVCTTAGFGIIYVNPNYEVWKPEPRQGPIFYITGDSYSDPSVFADNGIGQGAAIEGLGFGIGFGLGAADHYVDAIGGTAFIKTTTGTESNNGAIANNYEARLPQLVRAAAAAWANNQQDFVWFIPNGAANDVANYGTVVGSVTITQQAVVDAFRRMAVALRAAHSKARIIWGDGSTPPHALFANNAANYVALRTAIQTQCADLGIYFVDTTTWIKGTGYLSAGLSTTISTTSGSTAITGTGFTSAMSGGVITAAGVPANATVTYVSATSMTLSVAATATASGVAATIATTRTDGNASVYVGNDAVHLNGLGYRYMKGRYAPKLRRILLDTGALLNQVI